MSGTGLTFGAFLLLGMLIGAVHAGLLFRAVAMLAAASPALPVAALHATRFALVIAAFWFVAQAGAAALVAAAIGFTLALAGARFFVGRA